VDGNARLVNGELFKVGATVTVQLSVQVGKQTALQERVFSEVNTADNVTRLELFAVSLQIHSVIGSLIAPYHNLFGLSEIIARVAVQLHLAQLGDGDEFLRHDLGGVQEVKSKPQLVLLIHNLNAELIEFEISLLLLFPMFTRPLGKGG
jgi:hypothetical protein